MDLAGRNKIVEALESGLRFPGAEGHEFFSVRPLECELLGGEDAVPGAVDSCTFVDVYTHADPSQVYEALRKSGLFPRHDQATDLGGPLPVLKLVGFGHNDNVKVMSFEDLNSPDIEAVRL